MNEANSCHSNKQKRFAVNAINRYLVPVDHHTWMSIILYLKKPIALIVIN
jgi:hypothetical protein